MKVAGTLDQGLSMKMYFQNVLSWILAQSEGEGDLGISLVQEPTLSRLGEMLEQLLGLGEQVVENSPVGYWFPHTCVSLLGARRGGMQG